MPLVSLGLVVRQFFNQRWAKPKTNRTLHTRTFPRFEQVTVNSYEFWLVYRAVSSCCDLFEWFLWYWFFDRHMESALYVLSCNENTTSRPQLPFIRHTRVITSKRFTFNNFLSSLARWYFYNMYGHVYKRHKLSFSPLLLILRSPISGENYGRTMTRGLSEKVGGVNINRLWNLWFCITKGL